MIFHQKTRQSFSFFFFFNDTATTEIYTLSLHDALPISPHGTVGASRADGDLHASPAAGRPARSGRASGDRKSTRLNSSHGYISYAVFCLKKKKNKKHRHRSDQQSSVTTNCRNPRRTSIV